MWPLIFAWGPFQLRTLNVFLVVAFLVIAFVFWRKGREEHYPEEQLMDGFLLSGIAGFIIGRAGFIISHFDQFGFNVWHWLDLVSKPGILTLAAMIGAGWYLFRFASGKKWDEFEVLDFAVLAASTGLIFVNIGLFFDGTSFGMPTTLPWGVIFPGVVEKHHPVQLYFALFYLLLSLYLGWAEARYRTFEWYRAGKNSAQTGFLLSMFLIFGGAFSLGMSLIKPAVLVVAGWSLDPFIYGFFILAGIVLLLQRSNRLQFGKGSPKKFKSIQQFKA
jgi:prolipoprotein diacylglyceryltransferase